jgi:hypothetical protein
MFGLFSKSQPASEPVRDAQVQRVAAALDAQHEAAICDEGPSGHREYRQAEAVVDAAMRNATAAEIQAAHKAMRW